MKHFFGAVAFGVACLSPAFAQPLGTSPVPPVVTPPSGFNITRILGIATSDQPAVLTEKLRFQQYWLNTVGPVAIVGEGFGAALGQWRNQPKEWGQGAGAYGKRIGSNLAYNGIRQTITYASSAALHEDNRYFVSVEKGTWARTKYALASTVMARKPDGHRKVSFSAVSGIAGASILSSTWGPQSWKGPKNIVQDAGISLATNAAFNIVREFLPGMLHRDPSHP